MNINNKKNNYTMGPKINLEYIREQEQQYIKSYEFWSKNILERAERLDNLLKSEDPSNYFQIEQLQEEISRWQARGEREQIEINKFENLKKNFLIDSLISGCLSIKIH